MIMYLSNYIVTNSLTILCAIIKFNWYNKVCQFVVLI